MPFKGNLHCYLFNLLKSQKLLEKEMLGNFIIKKPIDFKPLNFLGPFVDCIEGRRQIFVKTQTEVLHLVLRYLNETFPWKKQAFVSFTQKRRFVFVTIPTWIIINICFNGAISSLECSIKVPAKCKTCFLCYQDLP